jgi:hypothetical protein
VNIKNISITCQELHLSKESEKYFQTLQKKAYEILKNDKINDISTIDELIEESYLDGKPYYRYIIKTHENKEITLKLNVQFSEIYARDSLNQYETDDFIIFRFESGEEKWR